MTAARQPEARTEILVAIQLVPVEVFGGCGHRDCHDPRCFSYGLSDAVSAWSDCNRAVGQIYRRDEPHNKEYRLPKETVTVYVDEADLAWFDRKFGDEFEAAP